MPDSKNQNRIVDRLEAVQRDIPGAATRDNEFAQPGFHWPADQRVTLGDEHGLDYQLERRLGGTWITIQQEVTEALQVPKGLCGVDQSRQDFALGLASFFPARRPSTKACTSPAA